MSPDGTVVADRVWKRFRGDRTPNSLRSKLPAWRKLLAARREHRWALRDVSLHAAPGESVGLIGRNGSGKSTLLRVLSRVMYPYAGSVSVTGRVGALIEVRAGIHPELTGRENIELYGTLLGFTRRDVRSRFDEIVEFAELGDAVDRQIKFFSSGMQMRLGFSIAAFLEPEVLLVDEVLAVGDASFQHKCLERMRAVLDNGTTLVFVSHDLAAVEALCQRSVWLDNGLVRASGGTAEVLTAYRNAIEESALAATSPALGPVRVCSVVVEVPDDALPQSGGEMTVAIEVEATVSGEQRAVLGLSDGTANPILAFQTLVDMPLGRSTLRCRIGHLPLPQGRFYVWLAFGLHRKPVLEWQPVATVDVLGPAMNQLPRGIVRMAPVWAPVLWEVEQAAATDEDVQPRLRSV